MRVGRLARADELRLVHAATLSLAEAIVLCRAKSATRRPALLERDLEQARSGAPGRDDAARLAGAGPVRRATRCGGASSRRWTNCVRATRRPRLDGRALAELETFLVAQISARPARRVMEQTAIATFPSGGARAVLKVWTEAGRSEEPGC